MSKVLMLLVVGVLILGGCSDMTTGPELRPFGPDQSAYDNDGGRQFPAQPVDTTRVIEDNGQGR
jgi:hypothetical protein